MKLNVRWSRAQNRYIVEDDAGGETLAGFAFVPAATINQTHKVRWFKADGAVWTEDYIADDPRSADTRRALVPKLLGRHGFFAPVELVRYIDESEVPRGFRRTLGAAGTPAGH